jgi:hypothetical protein
MNADGLGRFRGAVPARPRGFQDSRTCDEPIALPRGCGRTEAGPHCRPPGYAASNTSRQSRGCGVRGESSTGLRAALVGVSQAETAGGRPMPLAHSDNSTGFPADRGIPASHAAADRCGKRSAVCGFGDMQGAQGSDGGPLRQNLRRWWPCGRGYSHLDFCCGPGCGFWWLSRPHPRSTYGCARTGSLPGGVTSSVVGPVSLTNPTTDDPLTVSSTGKVNSTGSGMDSIDGTTPTAWTIANDGTVTSTGGSSISLAGGGTVHNRPNSSSSASISGSIVGIAVSGACTITNSGRVSGNEGIQLSTGGSVSNTSTGSITASGTVGGGFAIEAGIYIAHASGAVTNDGAISGSAYGVAMSGGGSVTNTASINGGEDGVVISGDLGTVLNGGQIIASVDDGIGMFAGGNVTNAAGALISGTGTLSAGVFITGGVGSVSNSGRITTNGGKFGVLLTGSGGTVSNAASAPIEGYTAGVLINGKAGTVTNAGSIMASGTAGVDLETGGSVGDQTGENYLWQRVRRFHNR